MNLYKLLVEDLHERGYLVTYRYGPIQEIKVRIPGNNRGVSLIIRNDELVLREYVRAVVGGRGFDISINGCPQLNLKTVALSNIYDPSSFEKVYAALDSRIAAGRAKEQAELEKLGLIKKD